MTYEANMKALQNLLYTITRLCSEMAGACAVAHSELQKYSDLPSEECVPSSIVDLVEQAEPVPEPDTPLYVKTEHICQTTSGIIPTQKAVLEMARETAKEGMPLVEYYDGMRGKLTEKGFKWLTVKGLRHYLYRINGRYQDHKTSGRARRLVHLNA